VKAPWSKSCSLPSILRSHFASKSQSVCHCEVGTVCRSYKDRGPGEVPLPPGPGLGNLLPEGNSLEYSLSGSNPRTNCSSGHHCALCSQSSEPTLRSFNTEMFWRRLTLSARWGTLAWTLENATNGHYDFSRSDGFDQYLSRDRRQLTRSCGRSLRPPAARLAIIGYCEICELTETGDFPRRHQHPVLGPIFLPGTLHQDHIESYITNSKYLSMTNVRNVNLLDQCKRAYQDQRLSRCTSHTANIFVAWSLSFVYASFIWLIALFHVRRQSHYEYFHIARSQFVHRTCRIYRMRYIKSHWASKRRQSRNTTRILLWISFILILGIWGSQYDGRHLMIPFSCVVQRRIRWSG
jgi:hypothetical protein